MKLPIMPKYANSKWIFRLIWTILHSYPLEISLYRLQCIVNHSMNCVKPYQKPIRTFYGILQKRTLNIIGYTWLKLESVFFFVQKKTSSFTIEHFVLCCRLRDKSYTFDGITIYFYGSPTSSEQNNNYVDMRPTNTTTTTTTTTTAY